MFPNNVIVAFDKYPQFRAKAGYDGNWPSWLEFGELVFPKSYRAAWIIDGQHRLYSFGGLPLNAFPQKLAVFAFETLPTEKQAEFFITINREQKEVSRDLIWDLQGEMTPSTPEGVIANCAKSLNLQPPLKGAIATPLSAGRQKGSLKLSGVCQDIDATSLTKRDIQLTQQAKVLNPLFRQSDSAQIPSTVGSAISQFLLAVQQTASPQLWSGILLRPGGITLALFVFQQVIARLGNIPTSEDHKLYASCFSTVLSRMAPTQGTIADLRRGLRATLRDGKCSRTF